MLPVRLPKKSASGCEFNNQQQDFRLLTKYISRSGHLKFPTFCVIIADPEDTVKPLESPLKRLAYPRPAWSFFC